MADFDTLRPARGAGREHHVGQLARARLGEVRQGCARLGRRGTPGRLVRVRNPGEVLQQEQPGTGPGRDATTSRTRPATDPVVTITGGSGVLEDGGRPDRPGIRCRWGCALRPQPGPRTCSPPCPGTGAASPTPHRRGHPGGFQGGGNPGADAARPANVSGPVATTAVASGDAATVLARAARMPGVFSSARVGGRLDGGGLHRGAGGGSHQLTGLVFLDQGQQRDRGVRGRSCQPDEPAETAHHRRTVASSNMAAL